MAKRRSRSTRRRPTVLDRLRAQVVEQERQLATLRELRNADSSTSITERQQNEGLRKQLQTAQGETQQIERLYEKEVTLPSQSRRVVRTCIIEGDPVWVAQQLKQSLAVGCNVVGSQPEGKQLNTITILAVSDETIQVQMRVAPQTVRQVPNERAMGLGETDRKA